VLRHCDDYDNEEGTFEASGQVGTVCSRRASMAFTPVGICIVALPYFPLCQAGSLAQVFLLPPIDILSRFSALFLRNCLK